ncbi:MAG: hypothetical protein LQ342_003675 [Letrouitia transgressa]|nr:MAG: hypothetical protein LQ342_003675 [Letrouitia transgressa]
MPKDIDTGRRLLANVIDSHAANDPIRVWASVPVNDEDLTQGFRDITYKEFADAINLASWWLAQNVASTTAPFQTVAYSGPKDLRYPVLAMAAVKCGKQLLLASSFSTSEALTHLLNVTNCTVYLHAASLKEKIQSAIGANSNVPLLAVPELSEWLFAGEARLPKPVVYTNLMMTSFDAAELMPDADQETMNDLFRDTRCYAPLPHLHVSNPQACVVSSVELACSM